MKKSSFPSPIEHCTKGPFDITIHNTNPIFSHQIKQLKQYANKLKKELNITHAEALALVAKRINCHHWHHVTKITDFSLISEDAYQNGLIYASDYSEISDHSNFSKNFIEDYYISYIVMGVHYEIIHGEITTCSNRFKDEYEAEYFDGLKYFRYIGAKFPHDIASAKKIIMKGRFWEPRLIRFKGNFYNGMNTLKFDDKGYIIGIDSSNDEFD